MNRNWIFYLLSAFLLAFLSWGCQSSPGNPGGLIEISESGLRVLQPMNPQTPANVTWTGADGSRLEVTTGSAFEWLQGRVDAVFNAFRPYHLSAIACAVVGAVILGTGYFPKRWGIALLAASGGLTATAHFLPAYGKEIFWLTVLMAVAGAVYWFWGRHQFALKGTADAHA